jgi:hypothetical protein
MDESYFLRRVPVPPHLSAENKKDGNRIKKADREKYRKELEEL